MKYTLKFETTFKPLLMGILFCFAMSSYAEPLTALIVDGQNNHNWQATTPVLKDILEENGLFKVDVATSPAAGEPMDDYKPDFAAYDVIVLNYNGDAWPQETQSNFVDYVKNGGGVVVFHAANNAFPEWAEFNEIIGLGGWGGRNENSGPMVRYRNGEVVFDESPGPGGTHGAQWAYPVTVRDPEHPITQGLPTVWLHSRDELYAKLRGPAKNLHVLATAPSKVSGEHEPMLFTIQYGEGRVFHDALGDNPYPMNNVGFAFTLQRGAQWAATGEVTLTDVPKNFPTAEEERFRLKPVSVDEISAYNYGQSRVVLKTVEDNIRNAVPEQFPEIEKLLIDVLQNDQATYYAKQFACRMLRRIGSEQSLPVLGQLLRDEALSPDARFALQGMASPRVNGLLRDAYRDATLEQRIGIIGTLGQRQDRQAVSMIARNLENAESELVRASIKALGDIGGQEAVDALSYAKVMNEFVELKNDALLKCADQFLAEARYANAEFVYQRFVGTNYPTPTRIAAYQGLVQCQGDNAVNLVISLLKDENSQLRQAAAGPLLARLPGLDVSHAVMQSFDALPHDSQHMVLAAMANRGHRSVAPEVAQAAQSDDETVSITAISTLGVIGDQSHVALLVNKAKEDNRVGQSAQHTLSLIGGLDVDQALITMLEEGQAETMPAIVQALVARRTDGSVLILLEKAKGNDAGVRTAAIEGIKQLAGEEHVQDMIALIGELEGDDVSLVHDALFAVAQSVEDQSSINAQLIETLDSGNEAQQISAIKLLQEFGGQSAAQKVVQTYQQTENETVNSAAFDAITRWPNADIIDELEAITKAADDETHAAALNGYLRMIGLSKESTPETMKRYQTAFDLATTPEHKAQVIEAVSNRTHVASLEFLEPKLEDEALGDAALAAYRHVVSELEKSDADKSAWKVSASHNSGDAQNAIDGNKRSRWATGTPQVPGQWFMVDLGAEFTVNGIRLDAENSSNDYPRGYKVYVSTSDENWGDAVVEGKGESAITEIELPDSNGRFVKIEQTGSVDGLFWSIHEMDIQLTGNQESLEHAKSVLEQYQ